MAELIAILLASPALASAAASAVAGTTTLVALLSTRRASEGYASLVGSFAAAALFSATLLHLWPEASALTPHAGAFALAGFALVYVVATLSGSHGGNAAAIAPLLGIGVHSFLDGALHATVFAVDLHTGLVAAPGLVLHEVSETALLYVLMLRVGVSRWPAAGFAFLGAVATTPLGAVASVGPISALNHEQLGWALAASAGSLIYLSVAHLADGHGEVTRGRRLIAFAAGAGLSVAVILTPSVTEAAHDHDVAPHVHDR